LYSIDPSQGSKLQRVTFPGNAPLFSTGMIATTMGSQIVTYGSGSGSATTSPFNTFDVLASAWSGPGLVKPSPIPSSSTVPSSATTTPTPTSADDSESKAPIGAIVGGVVGGLVVIALLVFLFIRHRRNNNKEEEGPDGAVPAYNNPKPTIAAAQVPPQMQLHPQMESQQQQPGFDPRVSYYSQPPQSPTIFQAHQTEYSPGQKPLAYNYTPPVFGATPQQQQSPQHPTIFQQQTNPASSPVQGQGQMMYSPAQSSSSPTAIPYSPAASQTLAGAASNQHYPSGYV